MDEFLHMASLQDICTTSKISIILFYWSCFPVLSFCSKLFVRPPPPRTKWAAVWIRNASAYPHDTCLPTQPWGTMPSQGLNLRPGMALIPCQVQLANASKKLKLSRSKRSVYLIFVPLLPSVVLYLALYLSFFFNEIFCYRERERERESCYFEFSIMLLCLHIGFIFVFFVMIL